MTAVDWRRPSPWMELSRPSPFNYILSLRSAQSYIHGQARACRRVPMPSLSLCRYRGGAQLCHNNDC